MRAGRIGDVSTDGLGVLRENGRTVYVPFTYPGDVVRVERTKRRFGRGIATDFEVLEPSPFRQKPRCPHFGTCGGCLWQGLKYREQLRLKAELFERVTGISAPIRGSPRVWGFRNVSNFIVTTAGIGLKEYGTPFATFLMFFLGFLLTDVEKVLQYLTLGYCRE